MKYDDETINTLVEAIKNGDTVELAVKKAGITKTTFYEWLQDPDKSDFADAIKNAKAEFKKTIVDKLKKSLWDKALGFSYDETKTEYMHDPTAKKGEVGAIIVKNQTVTTKRYPPDTAALIFALTNLAPDEWKNRQNIEATGANGRDLMPKQAIDLDALTAEQKAAVLAIGEKIINSKESAKKNKDSND